MNIDLLTLETAIKAAKSLGLDHVPWTWLKYMESDWTIIVKNCNQCGGSWAWERPRPIGARVMHGCVSHHSLDINQLINTKCDNSSRTRKLLKQVKPQATDLGKIFFTPPESEQGYIIDREDFAKLDPGTVGWWVEINDFDVS